MIKYLCDSNKCYGPDRAGKGIEKKPILIGSIPQCPDCSSILRIWKANERVSHSVNRTRGNASKASRNKF